MLVGTVDLIGQVVNEFESGRKSRSILNAPRHPRRLLTPGSMSMCRERPKKVAM